MGKIRNNLSRPSGKSTCSMPDEVIESIEPVGSWHEGVEWDRPREQGFTTIAMIYKGLRVDRC